MKESYLGGEWGLRTRGRTPGADPGMDLGEEGGEATSRTWTVIPRRDAS